MRYSPEYIIEQLKDLLKKDGQTLIYNTILLIERLEKENKILEKELKEYEASK